MFANNLPINLAIDLCNDHGQSDACDPVPGTECEASTEC